MKQLIKNLLGKILKDYQLNRIYCLDLPEASDTQGSGRLEGGAVIRPLESQDQFASASDQRIRDHAWYLDEQTLGYGIFENDDLVCVCCFWPAGHPSLPTRFANLGEGEAAMVDLLTAPQCRGKGYALKIAAYAVTDLSTRGYKRLWTWVWHSNGASIRVFTKAGWRYSHFLAEFKFSQSRDYLRLRLPPLGR